MIDWTQYRLRSHTPEQLDASRDAAWLLDTGHDGGGDVLLGTAEQVARGICEHYEIERLPEHWSLTLLRPARPLGRPSKHPRLFRVFVDEETRAQILALREHFGEREATTLRRIIAAGIEALRRDPCGA